MIGGLFSWPAHVSASVLARCRNLIRASIYRTDLGGELMANVGERIRAASDGPPWSRVSRSRQERYPHHRRPLGVLRSVLIRTSFGGEKFPEARGCAVHMCRCSPACPGHGVVVRSVQMATASALKGRRTTDRSAPGLSGTSRRGQSTPPGCGWASPGNR